jgi:hypothetical protein
MAKKKAASKTRAARSRGPSPKHVSVVAEQQLHVHVMKGAKEVSHHIVQGLEDGTVRTVVAPAEAPPVQDPSPISGT